MKAFSVCFRDESMVCISSGRVTTKNGNINIHIRTTRSHKNSVDLMYFSNTVKKEEKFEILFKVEINYDLIERGNKNKNKVELKYRPSSKVPHTRITTCTWHISQSAVYRIPLPC